VLLAQRGAQVTIGCHETSSAATVKSPSSGGLPAAAARAAIEDDAAEDEFADVTAGGAQLKVPLPFSNLNTFVH
jgi:hypothetical protein